MIPFNLKEDKHKNHPMDGKYGVLTLNTSYAGYPITIVDNHDEVENGFYTRKPSVCLIHLSEQVRTYTRARVFDEFLYLGFGWQTPTYRMFDYKKEEVTDEQVIEILKGVLYDVQPTLQTKSCVGSKSDRLEDDPNYYEGKYVLNDEETYSILKCRTKYKIFKGAKEYYPHWNTEEGLLYEGEIDFDIYTVAIEVEKLRRQIVVYTNQLLDNGEENKITEYRELHTKLQGLLAEKSL
ncbi:hypothetical protein [Bacillus thuringiensis]|uniref:hypothetical protein n=1 Tax=Bacillus thuringiensis TaxID=1428 RepID=UPI000BFEA318|nr:hypothetical protein [Bacillus thuringiensis]PGT89987.1 hypothetical protein COD17_09565 [Bacillus thuringiensis]